MKRTTGTTAAALLFSALCASNVTGQPASKENSERIFQFSHTATTQDFQQAALLIGAIADLRPGSVDNTERKLTFQGTPDKLALADWLFNKLDKPANDQSQGKQPPNLAVHEYRLAGSGDNVIRIFYLTQAASAQDVMEVATVVRSLTNARRLFTYNAPRALAVRGTADQMALADWLFGELDKPASGQAAANEAAHQYRMPGGADDVVGVFYIPDSRTVDDFQRLAIEVRSTTKVPRLFTYNMPRAMALRGSAGQIAQADRLIAARAKNGSAQ